MTALMKFLHLIFKQYAKQKTIKSYTLIKGSQNDRWLVLLRFFLKINSL